MLQAPYSSPTPRFCLRCSTRCRGLRHLAEGGDGPVVSQVKQRRACAPCAACACARAEIAQAYLALPASTHEPPTRLVGWQKVQLEAGQAQEVTVRIQASRLAFWSAGKNGW